MNAMVRSRNGSARMASGSTSGRIAGTRPAGPSCSAEVSIWPVRLIVEVASSSPSSIAPESPMNIRAGKKLCGRKPMQAPAIATVIRLAVVARVRSSKYARR